jgi:hypothetical protein
MFLFEKKMNFNFVNLWVQKKGKTTNFFRLFRFHDPESGIE